MSDTCDASAVYGVLGSQQMFGPCVLRHRHRGPVHKAANGTTWTELPGADSDAVSIPREALRSLVEVAMWVSRGRSAAMTPSHVKAIGKVYPDAKARQALGALDDAGLLDQFREGS